jgi:hypothetical protein
MYFPTNIIIHVIVIIIFLFFQFHVYCSFLNLLDTD